MLDGIFGDLGSGKNIYATWYVLKFYCGFYGDRPIYQHALANFRITSPDPRRPVELLDKEKFKSLQNLDDTLVVLDESYLWADSRRSTSKENIAVSQVVLQSRKRGMDIVYIAQVKSSVDLRLRDLSQIWTFCERRCNCKAALRDITKCRYPGLHGFRYEEDWRSMTNPRTRYRYLTNAAAIRLLPYFDTREIVPFV